MTDIIVVNSVSIHQRENGAYRLNDLHAASDFADDEGKAPTKWLRTTDAQELVAGVEKSQLTYMPSGILVVNGGAYFGTYAGKYLLLAYAAWLSKAFYLHVLQVFDAVANPLGDKPMNPLQMIHLMAGEQLEAQRRLEAVEHDMGGIKDDVAFVARRAQVYQLKQRMTPAASFLARHYPEKPDDFFAAAGQLGAEASELYRAMFGAEPLKVPSDRGGHRNVYPEIILHHALSGCIACYPEIFPGGESSWEDSPMSDELIEELIEYNKPR